MYPRFNLQLTLRKDQETRQTCYRFRNHPDNDRENRVDWMANSAEPGRDQSPLVAKASLEWLTRGHLQFRFQTIPSILYLYTQQTSVQEVTYTRISRILLSTVLHGVRWILKSGGGAESEKVRFIITKSNRSIFFPKFGGGRPPLPPPARTPCCINVFVQMKRKDIRKQPVPFLAHFSCECVCVSAKTGWLHVYC